MNKYIFKYGSAGSSLADSGAQNLPSSFPFCESSPTNDKHACLKHPPESLWVASVFLLVKKKFFGRTPLTLKDTGVFK